MTNKYLEKIASRQDHVDSILHDHYERQQEIEQPIQDLHDDMDEMEMAFSNGNENPYDYHRSYLLESIRSNREHRLRTDLKLDDKHTENDVNAAKKLLANEDLAHLVNKDNASTVLHNFRKIPTESNGYKTLKGVGTFGGAVAGGAMGIYAGIQTRNPLAVSALGAAGAISGGMLGSMGFGAMLKNKIKQRDENIHTNREYHVDQAYEKLHRTLTPA